MSIYRIGIQKNGKTIWHVVSYSRKSAAIAELAKISANYNYLPGVVVLDDGMGRAKGAASVYSYDELRSAAARAAKAKKGRANTKKMVAAGFTELAPRKNPVERLYNIFAVNNKTGARALMSGHPLTHREAMTNISKISKHKGRSIIIEEAKRKNPVKKPLSFMDIDRAKKINKAKKLREGFYDTATGAAPKSHKTTRASMTVDPVQMAVGVVEAIEYTVLDKNGKRIPGSSFRHEFTGKSCPTLTTSSDGRQLYFVGGNYHFKTDGINDIK